MNIGLSVYRERMQMNCSYANNCFMCRKQSSGTCFFPSPKEQGKGPGDPTHTATVIIIQKHQSMKYIRISPNVEYSTDMDFFLEHQILCMVSKEGTKFCSLIENRLFMRSDSRHISRRMQLGIMREIHKDICRLCYGGEPVD